MNSTEKEKPEIIKTFDPVSTVYSVCFSPDQTRLCVVGSGWVVLYDLLSLQKICNLIPTKYGTFWCVDYSPNEILVAAGSKETTEVFDTISQKPLFVLKGHSSWVKCVQFTSNGKTLLSGGYDNKINFWDIETKKCVSTISSVSRVLSIDISKDDRIVVSGHGYPQYGVKLWDFRTKDCIHTYEEDNKDVDSVKFHPDEFCFGTGNRNKTIKLFDLRNSKSVLQTYNEHSNGVSSIDFHPNGKHLISGSADRTIKIYDLLKERVVSSLCNQTKDNMYGGGVNCVQFSSDGSMFASGRVGDRVRLWRSGIGVEDDPRCKKDLIERIQFVLNVFSKHNIGNIPYFTFSIGNSSTVNNNIPFSLSKVFLLL